MYNMPMGYVETKARELASRPGATKSYAEWLADLNAQYGMDKGVVQGYFVWLGHAVRGEWGDSWAWTLPVTQEFHNTVWYSFILSLISFIFEILIAIPLGITAAKKQYSFTDYLTTVVSMVCISMPTFFLATLLKYVFSVKLGWFDLSGMQGRNYLNLSEFGKFLDVAKHFVLPSITIVIISIGGLMRYTRTNMLEVLNADYIRTARAKGVKTRSLVLKHALRNSLIPVITYLGPVMAGIITGSFVVESTFSIPGLGKYFVQSVLNRDYPVIMATTVVLSALVIIMNLVVDISYKIVDPRISLTSKED
jgi:peptide/nickel transport system permease protein